MGDDEQFKYHSEFLFTDPDNIIDDKGVENWMYEPFIGYHQWFKNDKKWRWELIKQNGKLNGDNFYRILGWCDFRVSENDRDLFYFRLLERLHIPEGREITRFINSF